MQRVLRICHRSPLSRCVPHVLPINSWKSPSHYYPVCSEFLCFQQFFCTETDSGSRKGRARTTKKSPRGANAQQQTKDSLTVLVQRALDSVRLLNVLNEKPWDEDTQHAVQSCNARLTLPLVCEVVRMCTDLDTGLAFYKWWRAMDGNMPNSHMYVALMHRLGDAGRVEELEALASECEADGLVSVATFTVQMASYRRVGNLDGAIYAWKRMEKFGLKPNLLSYSTMIDAFATVKLFDEAADLYLALLWEGFYPNVRTLTVMIHHLAEAGKMDAASAIFDDLIMVRVKPNAITYVSMLKGYAKVGDMETAVNLVRQLRDRGLRPHQASFKGVFLYLIGEKRVDDAVKLMLEMWPEYTNEDWQGLILDYKAELTRQKCEQHTGLDLMSDASDASDDEGVEKRPRTPTSLWNFSALIRCLTPWQPSTAAALEHANIQWDGCLVSEIMKRIGRVDVGWNFFKWVEGKGGFVHDKFTYTRMISLLLTEGNFVLVKQLLVEGQSKDLNLSLDTYNKVLKICGMRREAEAALDVFMLLENAGLKPDLVSYHNLLHVLSKCKRYWRAATVLAEMQKAGLVPTAAMYSFVVSGFAEAGLMKYAKAYYKQMRTRGFEPSDRIYESFIGGYHRAGRQEKAEQVFLQLKKIGIPLSALVCELMTKVYRKTGNSVGLGKVQRAKDALPSLRKEKAQQNFDKYLTFHRLFTESFAESDDGQMYATG